MIEILPRDQSSIDRPDSPLPFFLNDTHWCKYSTQIRPQNITLFYFILEKLFKYKSTGLPIGPDFQINIQLFYITFTEINLTNTEIIQINFENIYIKILNSFKLMSVNLGLKSAGSLFQSKTAPTLY